MSRTQLFQWTIMDFFKIKTLLKENLFNRRGYRKVFRAD